MVSPTVRLIISFLYSYYLPKNFFFIRRCLNKASQLCPGCVQLLGSQCLPLRLEEWGCHLVTRLDRSARFSFLKIYLNTQKISLFFKLYLNKSLLILHVSVPCWNLLVNDCLLQCVTLLPDCSYNHSLHRKVVTLNEMTGLSSSTFSIIFN